MGLRVHVLLISPGETETEDVIVEEVTRSHARASFLRDVVFFFFFSPSSSSSQFQLDQQTHNSTNTPKLSFYSKRYIAHIENLNSLTEKYSTATSIVKRVFSECPTAIAVLLSPSLPCTHCSGSCVWCRTTLMTKGNEIRTWATTKRY